MISMSDEDFELWVIGMYILLTINMIKNIIEDNEP